MLCHCWNFRSFIMLMLPCLSHINLWYSLQCKKDTRILSREFIKLIKAYEIDRYQNPIEIFGLIGFDLIPFSALSVARIWSHFGILEFLYWLKGACLILLECSNKMCFVQRESFQIFRDLNFKFHTNMLNWLNHLDAVAAPRGTGHLPPPSPSEALPPLSPTQKGKKANKKICQFWQKILIPPLPKCILSLRWAVSWYNP